MTESVGVRIAGGLWAGALSRMARDRATVISAAVIAVIALLALIGPLLIPFSQDALDWQHIASPPQFSTGHWLGTDRLRGGPLVRTPSGGRIFVGIRFVA